MTLLSTVLTLQPIEEATLPMYLGRAVHAWWLREVEKRDAELARRLHEPNAVRPFTVSNLWPLGRASGGQVRIGPGQKLFLRVTALEGEVAALLREVVGSPPRSLCLADARFEVQAVTFQAVDHPWAGQADYEELVQRHTLSSGRVPPQVTLRFASPTVFRSRDRNVPLPQPDLVFGSLLNRWNEFAPLRLPEQARRFAQECLALSRYRTRTEYVQFGEEGRGTVGFIGECRFAMLNRDAYWMRLMHLLAAFSLYAGVGRWTTAGLGQARVVEGRRSPVAGPRPEEAPGLRAGHRRQRAQDD